VKSHVHPIFPDFLLKFSLMNSTNFHSQSLRRSKDELVPELLVLHPAARCWLQQLPEVQDP